MHKVNLGSAIFTSPIPPRLSFVLFRFPAVYLLPPPLFPSVCPGRESQAGSALSITAVYATLPYYTAILYLHYEIV